tara:strand:- start:14579 stop:14770 length:192 start_codon:yes stop_codon:yes gene_type:complete
MDSVTVLQCGLVAYPSWWAVQRLVVEDRVKLTLLGMALLSTVPYAPIVGAAITLMAIDKHLPR